MEEEKRHIVNYYEAGANCQVFTGNNTGCVFAMPGSTVNQYTGATPEGATPLTVNDKVIKAVILELLGARDGKDELVFKNKKQWWAVFRVLSTFCHYPYKMTVFETKMKELEVDKVDGKRDLSYDSLSAAPKELPLMATCSPSSWNVFKDINENYLQQYAVAEFLMLKLGIKS